MFLFIYQILFGFGLIGASPILLLLLLTKKHFRAGLGERLGFYPAVPQSPVLWIHGASVGEIQTILPFLEEIKSNFPKFSLFFSATTMSGVELLKSKKLECAYFPLDLYWIARKVIEKINPQMIWVLETELWPSFLSAAQRKKIPLFLLNGRISDPSLKRYQWIRRETGKILNCFTQVLAQTEEDKNRFLKLGLNAKKCAVTGNIKFDAAALKKPTDAEIEALKEILAYEESDLIWVAGSTHGDEEKICIEIYQDLSKTFHNLRLVLAPRHLTRVKEIEKMLDKNKIAYTLRSQMKKKKTHSPVILVDTLGELYKIYALANVVFIGRSLSGFGGQNPLEPAIFEKPILFGPHMENFRQAASELLKLKVAFQIDSQEKLQAKIAHLLHNPDLAQQIGRNAAPLFSLHHGASHRTWQEIKKLSEPLLA